ncbi:MAG: TauD/TfdA family dioxygenase [Acidimicrobiales bacterium]|nr:TauD/TfdA family dioxygenase [Acidimicrobiales bacterium]
MSLQVTPLRAALGATVERLDADALDATTQAELRQALLAHKVLFFPGQHLTTDQQVALGSVFGRLEATTESGADHRQQLTVEGHDEVLVLDSIERPSRADAWHADVTFAEAPPMGALLSMQVCAPSGGDTIWANAERAYAELSPAIKRALEGLTATHGRPGLTAQASHPVVQLHPETGKPVLFVNRGWTSRIDGMSHHESTHLLALLFDHMERPEYTVRWSWSEGDAALWDNRCTLHYAIWDYGTEHRRIHRVAIYD